MPDSLPFASAPVWLVAALEDAGEALRHTPLSFVDVGASKNPPANQKHLASIATYLGFDPDLRLPQVGNAFGFVRHTMVNKAISVTPADSVTFNLTRYPECSSTLVPDRAETDRYSIGNLFEVVGHTSVGALTIEEALASAGLRHIDWLKLDTQGTDHAILASLSPATSDRLLMVDVEPGITPFYCGENTVAQVHEHMIKNGFWLADLAQQRFPRISPTAIDSLALSAADVAALPGNPFALELQYIRTVEWIAAHGGTTRDFLALWILAMANGHTAFALEVSSAAPRHGLPPELARRLAVTALATASSLANTPRPGLAVRALQALTPPLAARACRKLTRMIRSA